MIRLEAYVTFEERFCCKLFLCEVKSPGSVQVKLSAIEIKVKLYVSYNTQIFVFCFKTLALSGTSHTNKRILKESYLTGCNRSLFIYFLLLPLTRQHFSVLKLKTFITKPVDRKWSKSYYLIRLSSFIKLSSVERALRPTGILPGML